MGGLHAQLFVEDRLADAQVLGRDLKQLVVGEELEALLQAHLLGRDKAQRVVRAGSAHVRELLLLAHVDRDVLLLGGLTDDHTLVHVDARADEQHAALLRVEEAIGDRGAGLGRDERAGIAAGKLALVGCVGIKHARHDALALGVGEELVAVTEQAARGDQEFELHAAADRRHLGEVALAGAELFDDCADILLRHVAHKAFDGLALLAVDHLIQDARGRDLELIAFAAHGLDEDGQRHFAAARDVERVRRALELGDAERNVLERFAEETVAQLARGDKLTLTSGVGRVVDGERHLHRGGADLDERERLDALGRADRIADRDVADAGQADDVARGGLGDGVLGKALKFVHGDGLGLLRCGVGVVVVADHDLLVLLERAALDAADGHAADILVVVNGGDEHLERRVHIGLRRGDILKDRVKQGL